MKTMRALAISAGAILAAASAWAQTIQFVNVTRRANYVQTTDSTISSGTLVADPTTPFLFRAAVEGDNFTTGSAPLTAASYTKPGGVSTPLIFNSGGKHWIWDDTTQTSMANLNSAYGVGSYAFNLTGTPSGPSSVTVSSFAGSLLATPVFTLSGGSWSGGSYVINSASTLTINMNPIFTGSPAGTQGYHFDSQISGPTYINGPQGFANYDPTTPTALPAVTTPPTWTVNPGTLIAGTYTIDVSYTDIQNYAKVYTTFNSASLLEYRTAVNLTVIPEPSTYAAIFGAVALAGVMLVRRRRTA